jgi:hypothetical protein
MPDYFTPIPGIAVNTASCAAFLCGTNSIRKAVSIQTSARLNTAVADARNPALPRRGRQYLLNRQGRREIEMDLVAGAHRGTSAKADFDLRRLLFVGAATNLKPCCASVARQHH